MNIKPTTSRRSDGWAAILEFRNGGRQQFTNRHGTMEEAQLEANHALRVRLTYPDGCVPDPAPHRLMILATLESVPLPDGAAIENHMLATYPTLL